ncbi:MAG: nucleoside phosphorylase [Chitinophagales bacterium]|nr:nucleoside phosphorylase [Chitinophagales bacterium]
MKGIAASELILNSDKSIYHLGVKPGEVAPTIITVGDPDRVPMVSQYFDEIFFKVSNRELVTHTGRIGNKNISVISTGMGTDNIDIVFNELDAIFNIDFETKMIKEDITSLQIIRLGTSGTINEDIPLNTIIASELAIGYDGLLGFYSDRPHRFSHIQAEMIGEVKGYIVPGSEYLLEKIARDYLKGITYTASGFYAPQGRQLRASTSQTNLIEKLQKMNFPDNRKITNIEMETAGLYGLGHLLGHEVVSISVILANRVNGTFSTHPEIAIKGMLEECIEKIANL